MTSSQSSTDGPALSLEERLAGVKAEGRRRRMRRLRLRSAAVGVLAAALVGGVVVWTGDDTTTVRTELAADATTSTTSRRSEVLGTVIERESPAETPSTADPGPAPPDPTTTLPPAPATTSAPTVTPAPIPAPTPAPPPGPCQSGPECGPFRWEPAPAPNQPLLLAHDPVASAVVGTPVTITLRWSDGDAQLSWIDDDTDGLLLAEACEVTPRYGPWAPPPASGGSGSHRITVTPDAPGTATIEVHAATGHCDGYDPYRSVARLTITFEVAPPEASQP